MNPTVIAVTAREKAELLPLPPLEPLGENRVRGRTLASLVSPGTELSWNYLGQNGTYPTYPGYSAVFEVQEVGAAVQTIKPGMRLFCMGGHRSLQEQDAVAVTPIPDGLSPQEATVARLMGVSMTTLMTTRARPGDVVLVTGLGPIGYLCAHLFAHCGYRVRGVDPNAPRRSLAERSGLATVDLARPDDEIQGKVALVVDCSGHEQAVLDAAKVVRKGGEICLVGVPWKKCTDLSAHELLHLIFHKYLIVRSGWEWELPREASDFRPHSIYENFRTALRWLGERRIPLEGLISLHKPGEAQNVYQNLLHGTSEGLFEVFDWQNQVQ